MRLFVAVPVPEDLREKVSALGNGIAGEGIVPVKAGNMHLTLKFIGEVQPQKLDDIKRRLAEVPFSKFGCTLKGAGAFPTENYVRVLWAGCESGGALEALAAKVIGSLKGYGGDERFTAHLTIARVKKKADFGSFLLAHKSEEFGSFEVSEFHLVESTLGGPGGPQYRKLAIFRAQG